MRSEHARCTQRWSRVSRSRNGTLWTNVRSSGSRSPEPRWTRLGSRVAGLRSEEHTSELQSRSDLVCRLLLEKKKNTQTASKPRNREKNSIARPKQLIPNRALLKNPRPTRGNIGRKLRDTRDRIAALHISQPV